MFQAATLLRSTFPELNFVEREIAEKSARLSLSLSVPPLIEVKLVKRARSFPSWRRRTDAPLLDCFPRNYKELG